MKDREIHVGDKVWVKIEGQPRLCWVRGYRFGKWELETCDTRRLIRRAPNGIHEVYWVIEVNGTFTYAANSALKEMTGYRLVRPTCNPQQAAVWAERARQAFAARQAQAAAEDAAA